MKEYIDFLKTKEMKANPVGFEATQTNPKLFKWQSEIVKWAIRKGKACIFADCGLGKTAMQLQWANQVSKHTKKPVLILAPLAVAVQTKHEGEKFDITVNICKAQDDIKIGVNITNYEKLEHFDTDFFSGVVLDESSILKDATSATRKLLTEKFLNTPFKLCCTATPSPNDFMEIGTHAQFLGIMTQAEMLSTFFCHDGGNTSKWRLKGHAEQKFFEWIASWACCLTSPQDLGYDGSDYQLPELKIHEIIVKTNQMATSEGQEMFLPSTTQTLNERRGARRNSIDERVKAAALIANNTKDQVLVWCDLNNESEKLSDAIKDSVEVRGSNTSEFKETAMNDFTTEKVRVLVSKPSIAGWGMNWQQCHKMIFVGLSDSFEAYYQAVRRCWRFGQKNSVDVYIITSDAEGAVKNNIYRKQRDAQRMTSELVRYTKDILKAEIKRTVKMSEKYITLERMVVPSWIMSA